MERLIDVENRHLRLLRELLSAYLTNKTVWAYGSRVKWKASPVSDLDLVVWGATGLEVANAKDAFVESDLPFTVQLLVWEDIPEDFKENIRKKYVVLQEGNKIPKGWREVRLGEVAELSKATWKVGDEQFPYVGLENIDEDKLRLNSVGNSSDVESNKYRFKSGDTLFGKLRPYFRKVVKPNFDGICSTDIWVIRQKEGTDRNFLFYFFANRELVEISYSSSGGTRMPRADWDFLSQTVWNIPPLPEQKAIAEVLSSLDDKIDLLHRQNKTLEGIAQTLFRQWFVEKAGVGWGEVKLGDYFPVLTGKKDANYSVEQGDYPFFTCSQKVLQAPDYSFEGKAILLAGNGDFNVKRYEGKFEAYQRTYVLIPYEDKYFGFLYTLIKFYLNQITGGAQGSVIQFITKSMIDDFTFLLPKINCDSRLEQINEVYLKADINQSQIRTLEKLRDTLLPKLVGGEVRMKK